MIVFREKYDKENNTNDVNKHTTLETLHSVVNDFF